MKNKKILSCCFTGHRPNKLPWKDNEKCFSFFVFNIKLTITLLKLIWNNNCRYFTSGMALGIDLICAEKILKLKKFIKNITLECAIPCLNQTAKWLPHNIDRYNKILSLADKITYTSNKNYFNGCMQLRNKYMIDNNDIVFAIYNGSNGGTQQTINYAKLKNKNIILIKP